MTPDVILFWTFLDPYFNINSPEKVLRSNFIRFVLVFFYQITEYIDLSEEMAEVNLSGVPY